MRLKHKLIIASLMLIVVFMGFLILNYSMEQKVICADMRESEVVNYTLENQDSYKPTEPYPPIRYKP